MDSIKAIVIGDPHFKTDNVLETDEMTDKIVKVCESIKPNFIVVLGDVLHQHEKIHVNPLMRAEKFIRLLSEISPTFVLIGNHDRPNNSTYMTNEHPFNALKQWKNTYVVDEKVLDVKIQNYRFLFLPYVYPGMFEDTLNHTEKGVKEWFKAKAIFCHQEFYGAKMGAIKSQCGDKWDVNHPLIISGHIHDYDKLQDNIIYVGTPIQHSYSDYESKGISLFHFNNEWSEDRIDLNMTKKVIIYLTPEEVHTYEPPTDKSVKIVIRGDDAALKSISKLEIIKIWKKRGIKIAYKEISNKEILNSVCENEKRPKLKLKYKDRLYTTICNDEKQLTWFNKLFK